MPQADEIVVGLGRPMWKDIADIAMQSARPVMAALSRHAAVDDCSTFRRARRAAPMSATTVSLRTAGLKGL
jgi:hypothetical protein